MLCFSSKNLKLNIFICSSTSAADTPAPLKKKNQFVPILVFQIQGLGPISSCFERPFLKENIRKGHFRIQEPLPDLKHDLLRQLDITSSTTNKTCELLANSVFYG